MIEIINPLKKNNWNDIILQQKHYSFFHSKEWAEVLYRTYGYLPKYFCYIEDKTISCIIPFMQINSFLTGKRIVSLPFSDFCEPIFTSSNNVESLKVNIINYSRKNKLDYIEFRSSETKFPFDSSNYRTDLRHILFIGKQEEDIYKSFSENTRRNIKKASKEGVNITIKNDLNGIESFYKIFCETRKRHGLPPQPFSFFKNIYMYVIIKGFGDIIFAEKDNRCTAGSIYFKFGKKVLYKFGASESSGNTAGSNHLIMWEAIKKYNQEGYEEFDFGRTEINHEGLRRFKLSWHSEERFIYTSRLNVHSMEYNAADTKTEGIYNKVFNKLPLFVLKIVGSTLYKHIG